MCSRTFTSLKAVILKGHLFPDKELRPDLIAWNSLEDIIIIGELTVPMEHQLTHSHKRKKDKYFSLKQKLDEEHNDVYLLPFEVSVRGHIEESLIEFLKHFKLSTSEMKAAKKSISKTALECSYKIFLNRNSKSWIN